VAKKMKRKPTIYLTNRALRDIADIEAYSVEQFGNRAADRYISTLDAGISRIALQPDLLLAEESFHETLRFYRIEKHLLVCETGVAGKIIILTVLHASMDIPSRLAELEPNLVLEVELLLKQLRTAERT
jgi:plasmid stabilization system protein ParE